MRILILTSLFPPDPGNTALYVKELAERLAKDNTVTLLIYGTLPETVSGVTIHTIDKRRSSIVRLTSYLFALIRLSRNADRIVVENAPATELPVFIASVLNLPSYILCTSDPTAFGAGRQWYSWIHARIAKRALAHIELPQDEKIWERQEWLPYESVDASRLSRHGAWWHEHVRELVRE